MLNTLENVPATDPVVAVEQRVIIDRIMETYKDLPGGLMVMLNAAKLRMPVSKVHGVVSFYSFFTTTPRGRHTIKFCMGTACYVGGTPQLIEKAKQVLGIEPGQTTKDGNITLELCRCVGACSQAPVIVIDEESHGRVRPNKLPQLVRTVQIEEAKK